MVKDGHGFWYVWTHRTLANTGLRLTNCKALVCDIQWWRVPHPAILHGGNKLLPRGSPSTRSG